MSPLLPALSKSTLLSLDGLTVYEVRTERDDRENSITYLDSKSSEGLSEWPEDTEFAAVTMNWRDQLFTIFADGQLWLDSVLPKEVPQLVGVIGANLWGGGKVANI